MKRYRVLGLETGCDDTAAAVIVSGVSTQVLAERVYAQHAEHAPFGGVVPEIAARAHAVTLPRAVNEVLVEAGVAVGSLDAVAVTAGPGLIGGLITGVAFAQGLAAAGGIPLIGVNHLLAHALSPRIEADLPFPYLMLLISGGHCRMLIVEGVHPPRVLGGTLDDSPGEAFDKVAKMLGLGHPGGPAVERAARDGDPRRFALPRPMLGTAGCNFSFSGLKTAVLRHIQASEETLDPQARADLCASFEAAVADCFVDRLRGALREFRTLHPEARPVACAAGGVASNAKVRQAVQQACAEAAFECVFPVPHLCTDNAVMIAHAGVEMLNAGVSLELVHAFASNPW